MLFKVKALRGSDSDMRMCESIFSHKDSWDFSVSNNNLCLCVFMCVFVCMRGTELVCMSVCVCRKACCCVHVVLMAFGQTPSHCYRCIINRHRPLRNAESVCLPNSRSVCLPACLPVCLICVKMSKNIQVFSCIQKQTECSSES